MTISQEQAANEVVADYAGDLINDRNLLEKFVRDNKSNRTLLEKFLDVLRDIAAKLKGSIHRTNVDEAVKLLEKAMGEATAQVERIESGEFQTSEAVELSDAKTQFSLRKKDPPKKTGVAYKVFLAKDGELYPPMVANPGGAGTPVGVWLDADVGKSAPPSKTGRPQVQGGGKGTNSGKISLAFRPGWHLGDIPHATQFAKKNPETGKKELFPANFVWAECEYAMDVDYQEEAMSYGYTESGKFRHSYAGLPRLPEDGYYRYRTNPNPDTVPWIITGSMKVNKILTDEETDAICRENGVEPMARVGGPINLSDFGLKAGLTVNDSVGRSPDDGKKNAAKSNPYDGKSLTENSEVYSYDFLVNLPDMEVLKLPLLSSVQTKNNSTGKYVVDRKKAVSLGLENAAKVGKALEGSVRIVKNRYTGREIRITQKSLEHSLGGENIGRLKTNARLSSVGGSVVQNAVPVNALRNKNNQASGTYAMACLVNSSGRNVVALVTVEQYTNRLSDIGYIELTHSINGRIGTKKEGNRSSEMESDLWPATATFEISIADFLKVVNGTHKSILSDDVLARLGEQRNPNGTYTDEVLFSLKTNGERRNLVEEFGNVGGKKVRKPQTAREQAFADDIYYEKKIRKEKAKGREAVQKERAKRREMQDAHKDELRNQKSEDRAYYKNTTDSLRFSPAAF